MASGIEKRIPSFKSPKLVASFMLVKKDGENSAAKYSKNKRTPNRLGSPDEPQHRRPAMQTKLHSLVHHIANRQFLRHRLSPSVASSGAPPDRRVPRRHLFPCKLAFAFPVKPPVKPCEHAETEEYPDNIDENLYAVPDPDKEAAAPIPTSRRYWSALSKPQPQNRGS